jgi:hypothetical protein
MPTTTNYGWTTPADTDLVKDGAAAIRTLGSSIDTTLKTQIDAQIPDTLLTTTGDIIYASGASTPARLPIGTTGQILNVSGGVPAWTAAPSSGGMTLLSTTTLSGTSTTISSISQSYTNLQLIIVGLTSAGNSALSVRPNASTSNASYSRILEAAVDEQTSASGFITGTVSGASSGLALSFTFYNYSATTTEKPIIGLGRYVSSGAGASTPISFFGSFADTTAISSISINYPSASMTGGTALLYGVK